MGKAATREVRYSWRDSKRRAHREDKGDTAPVVMGTAPDSSASTINVPKGAFAHPTGLSNPANAEHLRKSIGEAEAGLVVERELTEGIGLLTEIA
uniref:Uncharacterized protein n=1 Tax=Candidatus Kentrum sp. DK TaxID=2126562 RepID=A0A450SEN4_9GAMM|nr:MAG: hypothetical protein BECKDK2373B_GA0170837_103227 [Candidatus Kentron sp. DK]